jgi:hypothetical protein
VIWFFRRKRPIDELAASVARMEGQLVGLRSLLLNQPRTARVLLIGEDESGNSWAWGRTVTLSPGETRQEAFQPQISLKPGLLVGCFGERVRLTAATAGQRQVAPFFDDGLFGRFGSAVLVGANVCTTLEADR